MGRLTEIAPGVLVATSSFALTTTTVITGSGDGCLLIDPGVTVAELAELAAELAARSLTPAVAWSTHPHWDHVLWSRELGGAPRYAAPAAVQIAQTERPGMVEGVQGSAPGHDLELFGRLTPLEAGSIPWDGPAAQLVVHDAHAPGHGAVFLPATGVFVVGDMCSDVEIPLLDTMAADAFGDYRAGLARLAAVSGVRQVVPGHGHVGDAAGFRRRLGADSGYLDVLARGEPFDDPRITQDWMRAAHGSHLEYVRRQLPVVSGTPGGPPSRYHVSGRQQEDVMPEIPEGYQALDGSERRAAPGARLVGPADPDETLSVTIHLRRKPGAPELPDEQYWADTPPAERNYLSRADFAGTYGASPDDVAQVGAFAREHGLEVAESDLAQRIVRVSGTTAQVSQAFGVELGQYETPAGRYRGREGSISVPAHLAEVIEGVFGLDNRQMARRAGGGGGVITPVTPPQVAGLYDFPEPGSHIGRETIGLLEFSDPVAGTCGYDPADINAYFTTSMGIGPGYSTPVLTDVLVNGATNSPGGPYDDEVALDIEVAGAVAQGAKIAVYFTTWDENGWVLAVKRAAHPKHGDPHPSVLSISWGWAELHGLYGVSWSRAAIHAVHEAFREAAAFGVTVMVASGDDGSNCQVNDGQAHVYYPQSDPWVTCCGGTTIENVSGSSFDEVTWNDNGITGGGISDVFDLPFWQKAAGVPLSVNAGHRQGRGIPDIAGYANGYSIVFGGANQGVYWGTSETAPLYAALTAVINSRLERRVGYLNPLLYVLGGTPVFRDIDDGGSNAANGAPGYTAGPGWDACTGWGSVNGHELLHKLRRFEHHF